VFLPTGVIPSWQHSTGFAAKMRLVKGHNWWDRKAWAAAAEERVCVWECWTAEAEVNACCRFQQAGGTQPLLRAVRQSSGSWAGSSSALCGLPCVAWLGSIEEQY